MGARLKLPVLTLYESSVQRSVTLTGTSESANLCSLFDFNLLACFVQTDPSSASHRCCYRLTNTP